MHSELLIPWAILPNIATDELSYVHAKYVVEFGGLGYRVCIVHSGGCKGGASFRPLTVGLGFALYILVYKGGA